MGKTPRDERVAFFVSAARILRGRRKIPPRVDEWTTRSRSEGDAMPLITVSMFPGRSDAQKAALAEALTDAFLSTCGGDRGGVWVILDEVPKSNWAVGGQLRAGAAPKSE
ncbi:4-oxalocrotonate tautomerase family protein [Burkholderia sp. FERM BP-3421]|jgi:4-oxalocrotonate tautomerase|uniref:tautomerase family protein n=1 Tax=Burkholderia sp. FERM BP-3421 TaxID=1494466 RepID=UPI0023619DDC|nr:4-oxalocrotonate tautomerase family protein [Burkholderia sp. FERM BP-3421]WDD91447.1 4-oxalocrotonate tautomerase family protein [Burkholderia sp. FERM BP-3421]